MSLHRAFPVTAALGYQCATAMACAIAAQDDLDPAIGDAMAQARGHMARRMMDFALETGPETVRGAAT